MLSKFICRLLLSVSLLPGSVLYGQYTVTVAGNGVSACYLNESALCTPFSSPESCCVAPNGDMYITCGNGVKKVSFLTKMVSRVVGTDSPGSSGDGGPAVNALMRFAVCVRMDAAGNLYISEYSGHRIRKITASTGIITTIAGNGTPGFSGDGGPAANATINQPEGISIDPAGNVFFSDFLNKRIRRIDAATGIITTVAGNGTDTHSGDGGPATSAGVPYTFGICHDQKGNLYITEDYSNYSNRVRKVDAATGIITTIAGNSSRSHSGDGGLAVNASLIEPSAVAVDKQDNIYIAEYVGSRIRKIDATTGIITTIAGAGVDGFNGEMGLALSTTLNNPKDLFIDGNNNLFVCDMYNSRVRKIGLATTAPPDLKPVLTISASSNSLCSGNPVVFTATASYTGTSPVYTWRKNNSIVGTNSATYTGASLNTGDVISCTLSTLICGVQQEATSNEIVMVRQPSGPLSVAITASATTVCAGQPASFTATATNAGSNPVYQWKINGSNAGTNSPGFSTTALAAGDIVTCQLTSDPALSCGPITTVVSNAITMNVLAGAIPSVVVTASASAVCPNVPVTFTATAQNAGANASYQWKRNGTTVGANSGTYTAASLANQDEITCQLTPDNPCSNTPLTAIPIKIAVHAVPVISLSPNDTVIAAGAQVQLVATLSAAVSSFSWSPATAVVSPTSMTTLTTPVQDQTTYRFTLLTNEGCPAFSEVTVKPITRLWMPNAFTPNSDGVNDVFRIPANVSIELKRFTIYNRWGIAVFSTTDPSRGWDGTYGGKAQDGGVFVYTITGTENGKAISVKGTFVLTR